MAIFRNGPKPSLINEPVMIYYDEEPLCTSVRSLIQRFNAASFVLLRN